MKRWSRISLLVFKTANNMNENISFFSLYRAVRPNNATIITITITARLASVYVFESLYG